MNHKKYAPLCFYEFEKEDCDLSMKWIGKLIFISGSLLTIAIAIILIVAYK